MSASEMTADETFAGLVEPYRHELLVHCYRMLGGVAAAEDALQDTLLAAWRGLEGFEGRTPVRTWLYRIATGTCLRAAQRTAARLLPTDRGPARAPGDYLGAPVPGAGWLEPWPHDAWRPGAEVDADPEAVYTQREAVELAFLAALQHVPADQRAVLVLRDVAAFSAAETAQLLDTSTASVTSALNRARATVRARTPERSQQREQFDAAHRGTVDAFVDAFVQADVPALLKVLTPDVRLTMPPLPAWFDGQDDVVGHFAERVFQTPWRVVPFRDVNGQPAVVGYQQHPDGTFRRESLMVLAFHDGRVSWVASFLDPALLGALGIPTEHPPDD